MLDNYLEVNNQKLKVLFIFNYKERDFVVYELPDGDISASIMEYIDERLHLKKVESDEDWDYVDQMIDEHINKA